VSCGGRPRVFAPSVVIDIVIEIATDIDSDIVLDIDVDIVFDIDVGVRRMASSPMSPVTVASCRDSRGKPGFAGQPEGRPRLRAPPAGG